MDKPFLTIDQQIELLNSRGMTTDSNTYNILLSEGYYAIVNGYKEQFIDKDKTAACGDDRYAEGTRFSDLYDLFLFDRELRKITFQSLLRVETLARTLCSYRFCEAHQEENAYLNISNYTEQKDYLLRKDHYEQDLNKLISELSRKAEDRDNSIAYVDHYRDHHRHVPLWVLVNALSFGNIEHLFCLMKPAEQRAVCKDVAFLTGRIGKAYFSPKEARKCLNTLVKFRNLCAHDERLYCARVGRHKDIDYWAFLQRIAPFMSEDAFDAFFNEVVQLVVRYSNDNSLFWRMGFGSMLESLDNQSGEGEGD